jgi:hypothetical protein
MARPSKLTPELQKKICDELSRGTSQEVAAALAGITEAMKAMLDALTDRGCPYESEGQLLPDDGPKIVTMIWIGQEAAKEWKGREEVIMTVEECE